MPIAVSVQHLREVIVEHLVQKFLNDEEWIRLQLAQEFFWSLSPSAHRVLQCEVHCSDSAAKTGPS